MVTGRFHLRPPGAALPRRGAHAAFDLADATVLLTEAGTRKKARLHLIRGEAALAELHPGGLEPLDADLAAFRRALLREDRTLKRALTDPRILSGIGNAHSTRSSTAPGSLRFGARASLTRRRSSASTGPPWITSAPSPSGSAPRPGSAFRRG